MYKIKENRAQKFEFSVTIAIDGDFTKLYLSKELQRKFGLSKHIIVSEKAFSINPFK